MNISKIILILILSFNITAVCAKTEIDDLCLKMAKDKGWAAPNKNSNNIKIAKVVAAFEENSTNMKDQVKLYGKFNNNDLHDCLRLNYGFSFNKNKDLIITNKEKFSKLRLANNTKGIACKFPDIVEKVEKRYPVVNSGAIVEVKYYDITKKPDPRNKNLAKYNLDLNALGNVSFGHYCSKHISEVYFKDYIPHYTKKFNDTCSGTSRVSSSVNKECSDIKNDLVYIKNNQKKFEKILDEGSKNYKTVYKFDDDLYRSFEGDVEKLNEAVKQANDRMTLVNKVIESGLDKVADCMNKSEMNNVFTESFEKSSCRRTSEEVLGNLTVTDFEKVINGIENNYSSELAEKANQATFEKNIELFFKYASKDLKDVMKNEEKFCIMLKAFNKFYPGDRSGLNGSSAFKVRNIDAVISGLNHPVDMEYGGKKYQMGYKGWIDYGDTESAMCNKDNTLKSGYKESFDKVKNSTQPERPLNETVANDINTLLSDIKDSCKQLKDIEDNPHETPDEYKRRMYKGNVKYDGNLSGYSYFDPNVPKRIESETTIRSKFFEFVSQHKDSTTHMALLNMIKKQSQSHANATTKDTFRNKWLGINHEIKPLDTLGMCYLTNENNQLITPTITAEHVQKLNNELDYQLIRAIGENDDTRNPPGDRIICPGSERRDIHRIFKLLMSHPSTLGDMIKAEEDPSKRLLLLNATCKAIECIGDDRDRIIRNHEMLSGAFDIGSVALSNPVAQGAMRFGKLVTDMSKNRFLYGISEEQMKALTTGFLGEEYYNPENAFELLTENIDNMEELDQELTKIVTSYVGNEALLIGKTMTANDVTKFINSDDFKNANNKFMKEILKKSGLDGLDASVQNAIIKGHLNTVQNIIKNHDNPQKLVLSEVFNQAGVLKVKAAVKAKRLDAIVETMEKTGKENVKLGKDNYDLEYLKKRVKDLNNSVTGINYFTKIRNVSSKTPNFSESDSDASDNDDVEIETDNIEVNDDNNTDY